MTQSLAERLATLPPSDRKAALAKLTPEEAEALLHNWRGFLARPEQIAPPGDWDGWLILAGRGFGKSRSGAEWVREGVKSGALTRIALVGETAKDTRDVMVEGPSGILAVHPEEERPVYEPSKARVTWANGAVATLFNATEPDQLRGPQFDGAWCDELAKWRYARETFDQLQFGLRLGTKPRQIVTTTPRPIELVRELVANARWQVTRGSTFDNASNLAPGFLSAIREKYEGTRLGRQELNAEILDDIPGALWTRDILDASRRSDLPPLKRVYVGIDPAVTAGEDADEHGIIVAGVDGDQHGWVVADGSLRGSPLQWARRAVSLHDEYEADGIVVEVNQGGDMVAHTLRSVRPTIKIVEVRATRGKHVRAEPIAALYEQGRVSHHGSFPDLEDQMVLMTPEGYAGEKSPDRLDALVWVLTQLFPAVTKPIRKEEAVPMRRMAGAGSWMAR